MGGIQLSNTTSSNEGEILASCFSRIKLVIILIKTSDKVKQMSQFAVGDIWQYKHREGEEGSQVIINKIETIAEDTPVYHVSIVNVKVINPQSPSGLAEKLAHAPVSLETLQTSLTNKIATEQPFDEDYLEGYEQWREAYLAGQAGIFTITIAEIVNFIEQAINTQQ